MKNGSNPLVEVWPVSRLTPYANNPRNNDESVPKVAASIREFVFLVPIVARPDGEILAGHTRYKAALSLGLETVPVLVAVDLDDAKARAFRLADNKVGEFSKWDLGKLSDELAELDMDMTEFGFDVEEVVTEGMTDEDAEVELAEDEAPVSELGKVYRLGKHLLYCGSCSDGTLGRLAKSFGGAIVCFTDPPYGVSIGTHTQDLKREAGTGTVHRDIVGDTLRGSELEDMLASCFQGMMQACDEKCSYYICAPSADDLTEIFLKAMRRAGLPLRHQIIWDKGSPTFSMGRLDYDYQHEPIHYTWVSHEVVHYTWSLKHKKSSKRAECTTSVWRFPKTKKNTLHPTMKPVELYVQGYANSSDPGDVVLEPFGGSGTAYIAAEKVGRRCLGAEIDPHYCDVIRKRWAEFVHGPGCDWVALTPEEV